MSVWSVFKIALRAAIWRTTPEPQLVGLPSLLVWALVLAAVRVAFQFVEAGHGGGFNPYGLNAIVAWMALDVAVAALFVRPAGRTHRAFGNDGAFDRRRTGGRSDALGLPLFSGGAADTPFDGRGRAVAIFVLESYGGLAPWCAVLRSFERSRGYAVGRVAACGWRSLPSARWSRTRPFSSPRDFDIRSANWWETCCPPAGGAERHPARRSVAPKDARAVAARAVKGGSRRTCPADERRNRRLRHRCRRLGRPGRFLKELDGGLAAIGERPADPRTIVVRLINHRETMAKRAARQPAKFCRRGARRRRS